MRRRRLLAPLCALALLPALAPAQSFPTDDPVLRRIWTLGMDSSRAARYAQVLTDSIGPRLTGSPGQKAGNAWLLATYKELGIDARNEQYGTWAGWRRGTSHLDLMTPRVRSLEATMLAWSPGTNGKDVQAGTIILPDLADSAAFRAWLPQARGKFVLVSMAQPTCRPDDNWEKFATPASFQKMKADRAVAATAWSARVARTGYTARTLPKALEQAGAAGVLTSLWSAGWGVTKIFQARTERVPSFDLSCEDYGLVYRLTENGQGATLRARADAQKLGDVPVFNTIATIRGSEKPDEYVMLSAHFDSWDGSSGATDNATGTVTMLEAMRILRSVYPKPKRTILVGHWSGEEQGLNGSRAFAADHPEIVKGLQALFNQDNGTGRIVRIGGGGLPDGAQHVSRWLSQLPIDFQQQVTFSGPGTPSSGGSDDASFACYGAPAFGLGALGWDYGAYTWHTNRDTYDKIVFDDLKSNATLTAMLAYLASEDPTMVTRERVDLAALAAQRAAAGNGARAGRGRGPTEWPTCTKAARSTKPRLQ